MSVRGELIKTICMDRMSDDMEEVLEKILSADDKEWREGQHRRDKLGRFTGGSGGHAESRNRESRTKNAPQKAKGFVAGEKVHDLCKLDRKIYGCVSEGISSDDVIVTNERLQHVVDTHPEITPEEAFGMMKDAVESPDMIIQDSHKEHEQDTAIVMKRLDGKKLPKSGKDANMRLVMRLATGETGGKKKNSVITAVLISEKKWNKYARNKKVLYTRE